MELFDSLEKGELMDDSKLSSLVTDMHRYRFLFICSPNSHMYT